VAVLIGLVAGGFWLSLYKDNYDELSDNYKALEYGAYVAWGLAACYLLLLLCLCNRIRLGIAIIQATAKFIGDTP